MTKDEAFDFTSRGPDGHKYARYWLPYLFQKVECADVKWAYLPLNRSYKPLGVTSKDWVEYEDYIRSHGVKFSRDPALLKDVWIDKIEPGAEMLWLYNDNPDSRRDYFARFERVIVKAKTILHEK